MSSSLQDERATSYLSGGSMAYVDGLYEDFLADPNSVSEDWQAVFNALPQVNGQATEISHRDIRNYFLQNADRKKTQVFTADAKQAEVSNLINAYRTLGHHAAKLDPLDMVARMPVPALELSDHHLSEADLDHTFFAGKTFTKEQMPLREICQILKETYCGSIGIEYMHIAHNEEMEWLQKKLESVRGRAVFDAEKNDKFLRSLLRPTGLNGIWVPGM
mgnify:CR=1 FL=1